jgi:hypothetical protein
MKDWEKATVLCKVFKVFYDVTMLISGTSYPTSNIYFHEIEVKLTFAQWTSNADLEPMVDAIKVKLNKY